MMSWPNTPFWIWIDFEGTCWSKEDERYRKQAKITEIIEVGAVITPAFTMSSSFIECLNQSEETLYKLPVFNSYIRPLNQPQLSPYCIELTRIQQDQIDHAHQFNTVYTQFSSWLTHSYTDLAKHLEIEHLGLLDNVSEESPSFSSLFTFISWGYLDYPILRRHLHTFKLPPLACPYWDAQAFFNQTRDQWSGPRLLQLHNLAHHLQISQNDPPHRALSDVYTLFKVMWAVWNKLNKDH